MYKILLAIFFLAFVVFGCLTALVKPDRNFEAMLFSALLSWLMALVINRSEEWNLNQQVKSGSIYFIENNKVYFFLEDGVVYLSSFSPDEVEQLSYFEFIEEVFNY